MNTAAEMTPMNKNDIVQFARNYLASNAAESGADELIRNLVDEIERLQAKLANSQPSGYEIVRERQKKQEALKAEREQCAKIAENPGFIQARDTEWDEGVNYAKRFIAAAIRANKRSAP